MSAHTEAAGAHRSPAGAASPSAGEGAPAALSRLGGLGASDLPAVCSVSPFAGPWDVWALKTGLADPEPDNARTERGRWHEPMLRGFYAATRGVSVRECERTPHPKIPWLWATPDGWATPHGKIFYDGRLLEIKAVGRFMAGGWGDEVDGPDALPDSVRVQVTAQSAVCAAAWGIEPPPVDVIAEIGDEWPPLVIEVPHDPELWALVLERATAFWALVETRTPPDLDGSEAATRYLRSRYPRAVRPLEDATPDAERIAQRLLRLREARKRIVLAEDKATQHLMVATADREGIRGSGWRAKWIDKAGARVEYETQPTRYLDVRPVKPSKGRRTR